MEATILTKIITKLMKRFSLEVSLQDFFDFKILKHMQILTFFKLHLQVFTCSKLITKELYCYPIFKIIIKDSKAMSVNAILEFYCQL